MQRQVEATTAQGFVPAPHQIVQVCVALAFVVHYYLTAANRGQKCRAKGRSKKAQKQDTRKPTAASQVEVVPQVVAPPNIPAPQEEVPDVGTSIAVAASQGADVTSTPAASVGEDSTEGFDEESEQMLDTPWHYPIDADDIIWDQIAGLPRASSPHDSAGDVGGSEATLGDHPEVMDFVEDNLNLSPEASEPPFTEGGPHELLPHPADEDLFDQWIVSDALQD